MNLNEYKLSIKSNADLAKRIKANVSHRQALKKKWDKKCRYEATEPEGPLEFAGKVAEADISANGDNYVRLLDEGVVVEGDGTVYAVIKKGVVKSWYDSLPKDFVGNIDKDHNRSIDLGTFTKADLKLVELEDGRYGVDVNVKLDDELYATRDLKRMGNRKAISSEFYSEQKEFIKQSVITGTEKNIYGFDYLVPLIDEIQITGYAVVDSPKNANSYDESLLTKASTEKDITMTEEELKKQQEAEAAAAEAETEAAEEATEEATEAEDGEQVDAAGVDIENAELPAEETEEGGEEAEDESEATEDAEEVDEEQEEALKKFEAAIAELRDQIAEKDKTIADLEAKLSAKTSQKNAFMNKLETMLDFTTAAEKTDEETATTTPESKKEDEVLDEYAAAFKNL